MHPELVHDFAVFAAPGNFCERLFDLPAFRKVDKKRVQFPVRFAALPPGSAAEVEARIEKCHLMLIFDDFLKTICLQRCTVSAE